MGVNFLLVPCFTECFNFTLCMRCTVYFLCSKSKEKRNHPKKKDAYRLDSGPQGFEPRTFLLGSQTSPPCCLPLLLFIKATGVTCQEAYNFQMCFIQTLYVMYIMFLVTKHNSNPFPLLQVPLCSYINGLRRQPAGNELTAMRYYITLRVCNVRGLVYPVSLKTQSRSHVYVL